MLKKTIGYLILILSLNSCDVIKDFSKNKDKSKGEVTSETITYRVGDTVHYSVPKITYRDTTIYTTNKQGTTLRTIYSKDGSISNIDCFSSKIEEIQRDNVKFQNNVLNKLKHKEVTPNFDWVIYLVAGGVIVIIFALILFFIYIKARS